MADPVNLFSGIERKPVSQTVDLRHQHIRMSNYLEPRPNRTTWVHLANWTHTEDGQPIAPGAQVALPITEGAATFGPQIRVIGFERITLLVDLLGTLTDVNVLPQIGHLKECPQDVVWFDLHTDEATPGTLVQKVFTMSTGAGRLAFTIPTCGVYMRFKLWTPGGNATTRGRIQAVRHMDAS